MAYASRKLQYQLALNFSVFPRFRLHRNLRRLDGKPLRTESTESRTSAEEKIASDMRRWAFGSTWARGCRSCKHLSGQQPGRDLRPEKLSCVPASAEKASRARTKGWRSTLPTGVLSLYMQLLPASTFTSLLTQSQSKQRLWQGACVGPFQGFEGFFVNCSFAGLKSHAFSLPSSKPQTCHHTNQKGGRKPDLAAGLLHDHLSHTAGNGTCANAKHLQLDVDETSAHSASFCIALRKRLCLQEWVCGCPGLLQAGQRHPDSASGCRKCVRDGPVKLI